MKADPTDLLAKTVEPLLEQQADFMQGHNIQADAGWRAGVLSLTLPPKREAAVRSVLSYEVDSDGSVVKRTRLRGGPESTRQLAANDIEPGTVTRTIAAFVRTAGW